MACLGIGGRLTRVQMVKRDPEKINTLDARIALMREVEQLLRVQNEELAEGQSLLEDARDDYAELYDWAPLPLLTLGAQGAIRSANLATAELFERERSWLLGRSFRMLFDEHDRPRLTTCLSAGGGVKECRVRLVLPNETSIEVLLSRRFSLRKIGVLHVSLVDLRTRQRPVLEESNDVQRTLARGRILVVEDHLETAETMQEVLERHGYAVVAADSVAAAVGVDLTRVDALVSDILLPDGMGTDLLRQLRRERDLPAIAFSGLTRSSDLESVKQAGFDLFLSKPVDFPRLLTALSTLLAARSSEAASHPI
jgi:CheY-like chemotaxis protein